MLQTKRAKTKHLNAIMSIIDAARTTMQLNGNAHQWADGYPSVEIIKKDIEDEKGLIIVDDEDKVIAYYVLKGGPDSTYETIKQGQWLESGYGEYAPGARFCTYSVIHRIASLPNVHGIFDEIMRHCSLFSRNIRIDTHRDNHIMQHLLEKHGFVYCGIIFTERGDERLAYQRLDETTKNEDEFWERENAVSAWNFAQLLDHWNSLTMEEKEQEVIEKERYEAIYGRFWEDWTDDDFNEDDYHPGQKEYELEYYGIRKRLKKQGRLKFS